MLPPPRAAATADAARWIQHRYDWDGPWVTCEVGADFEAYVRVLHPYGDGDQAQTWAEVAAEHGKTMHPAAQWSEITADGPWDPEKYYDLNRNDEVYLQGNLVPDVLSAVCSVLRRHTTSPEHCYFAVWDGWGWDASGRTVYFRDGDTTAAIPQPSDVRLDPAAPHFEVPHRGFHLYEGVVEQALTIGGGDYYDNVGFFWTQSPTLMWPADHSWCLSTEIDAPYTVIGGSKGLVEELTSAPGVEAVRVQSDEPPVTPINQ